MLGYVAGKLFEIAGKAAVDSGIDEIVTNRRWLSHAIGARTLWANRSIRVSIAEILRLKSGQKYVLVQNARQSERVTPIGGVIRCFPSGLAHLQDKLQYVPEVSGGDRQFDLRGFVIGKRFPAFLSWLYSEQGRERQALSREIVEELKEVGDHGIADAVTRPEYRLVRMVHEGPVPVKGVEYWQYRLFYVYELEKEHAESKGLADAIVAAANKSKGLVLVSNGEIQKGRAKNGKLVGDSSGYLFGSTAAGAKPTPYR
ncbi:hypothetical protein Pla175_27590 [Pirellulimonas nuda]|uniref:CD-NTase-associated protein 16 NUDIX domain-containing protein n=1 Tax=Pirellulimonas nuda TaxID=2528009 RepID=A0A518DD36_9BACT|nr:hypothetical protein [Pirellulimonas nuda]QDU89370.1 hypothetical protein Pla175_27590 [Pirellulimonas nuda]